MSLFDKMLENEEYRKLFEKLPNDEQMIMFDAMRKLVEKFEVSIINPLQNITTSSLDKISNK